MWTVGELTKKQAEAGFIRDMTYSHNELHHGEELSTSVIPGGY